MGIHGRVIKVTDLTSVGGCKDPSLLYMFKLLIKLMYRFSKCFSVLECFVQLNYKCEMKNQYICLYFVKLLYTGLRCNWNQINYK